MPMKPTDPSSYTVRLTKVRAAIDEILEGGQNVSYNGRSLGMADLSELQKLEERYESRAAAEQAACGGRTRIIYVTPVT